MPDQAMTKRKWEFQATIPEEHQQAVVRSCMGGDVNIELRGEHTNALLCALPKSASLHTTQLLALSLGMENHPVGFDRHGGRIYYPRMVMAKYRGSHTISHCHNPPDAPTLKIIKSLGLRPVVLTRNLLDAMVSRRDMLVSAGQAGVLNSQKAIDRFLGASDEEQLDVTIALFATTFLNFAAGWFQHREQSEVSPVFITYEQMVADDVGMVKNVADALNMPFDPDRVREVSAGIRNEGGIHLSKGVAGRGKTRINERQIDRLREFAEIVGCYDEEFLGFELSPQLAESNSRAA